MSKFTLNPNFKSQLSSALDDWIEEIFQKTDDVIATPRYWEGWTTSNPFRDIVDTEDLRNSGEKLKISQFKGVIKWSTSYVGYVYYGFTLADGRTIPSRKWVEVAESENNYRDLLIVILKRKGIIK